MHAMSIFLHLHTYTVIVTAMLPFDVTEDILLTHTSSSPQITPHSDDPYMRVLEAYHAPDPDSTPTSPLPSQPTPTPTTDPTIQPTHDIPSTQAPTTRRRVSYRRVRGRRLQLSSILSSPPREARSTYTGTSTLPSPDSPIPSPSHSPPRQRLRRATESYSDESDPDEEPEEEPQPAEHITSGTGDMRLPVVVLEDVQREGKQVVEEAPSTYETGQSSRYAQIMGEDSDDDVPLGLGLRAATLRAREAGMDIFPPTFEVGQSSRGAHQEESDSEIWRDIECMVSTAPRIASPEYVPSTPPFVPSPYPSPPASPPPAVSSPEEGEVQGMEHVLIQLGAHAQLLDVHSDQLERLGGLEEEIGRLGRGFARMHLRLDDVGRDQARAWDSDWASWHRVHGLEFAVAEVTRAEQQDRFEVVAARSRIAQLESTVGRLESTVARLTAELEQLRLGRN